MFGLGFPEIFFILLIATLVLGPEHMPRAARMIGQWSAKLRSAATSFEQAVVSDEDMRELKQDVAEVKNELNSAKKELLTPTAEIEQLSSQAHLAYEEAKNELRAMQNGSLLAPKSNDDAPQKSTDLAENTSNAPISQPSEFMSRSLGSMAAAVPAVAVEVEKSSHRAVSLARPRFLPEAVSRVVNRRRVALELPENGVEHRVVALEKSRENAAFMRIRKLSMPMNADLSAQRRVRL